MNFSATSRTCHHKTFPKKRSVDHKHHRAKNTSNQERDLIGREHERVALEAAQKLIERNSFFRDAFLSEKNGLYDKKKIDLTILTRDGLAVVFQIKGSGNAAKRFAKEHSHVLALAVHEGLRSEKISYVIEGISESAIEKYHKEERSLKPSEVVVSSKNHPAYLHGIHYLIFLGFGVALPLRRVNRKKDQTIGWIANTTPIFNIYIPARHSKKNSDLKSYISKKASKITTLIEKRCTHHS